MTDLLVLHDVGTAGGEEWAAAFDSWPGRVVCPDLPGHDGTPPPIGGQYDTGDAVYVALELMRSAPMDDLVVVGVGHRGAAAQILALGGRAAGLVLVDGLGGPWWSAEDIDAAQRAMRRKVLTTPGALAEPLPDVDDPRATMIVGAHDRDFAVRQAAAMPVPVLVVETPGSPTPDADELVAHFARPTAVRIDTRSPALVADEIRSWWS